jgi:hypothetical protein
LNKGNSLRNTLFEQLKKSYPGLFDKIDIEKTTNSELLNILNDVNRSYERRISLSKNALEQQSLDKEQDYTMGIIGRAQQQLDYMKKGHTGFFETGMFSPYMEGFDNEQIRGWGFDEKSKSGLKAFIDYGLKDVDRIQKSKVGILMEQKREENQGLLSDAQKVLNDGSLKGTLKNNFRDLIVTTLRKFNAGTAVQDDFEKLKSFMPGGSELASNITKKKKKDLVDKDNSDNSITKGITGGGPRVININGVKFTDKIEIHSTTMGEGVGQLENRLQEMFLRILNSGASVQ